MIHQTHQVTVPAARSNLRLRFTRWRHALLRREARAGYMFVAPSVLILSIFVFWPIVQSGILSLQHWQFGATTQSWVGLANYERLLHDERAWGAFSNTFTYTFVVVPVGMILSLLLALGLNRALPGRTLLRACFFLPVIASFAVIAIVWKFLLDPDIGVFAYWGQQIGLPGISWLRSASTAMPAVMIVSIWKNIGFNMVIFLAGLQGISISLYEAATVDGANRWQQFWRITLPLLRPTTLFVLVISIISAFQVFDQVYVLTPKGGPLFSTEMIVTFIYYQGIELIDISYASSIGVVLFVIVLALTLIQLRLLRFREVD